MNSFKFDYSMIISHSDCLYNSFWKAFSFSTVRPGFENWDEFSFFKNPKKISEGFIHVRPPPLHLLKATGLSGFIPLDAKTLEKNRKHASKEASRSFREEREKVFQAKYDKELKEFIEAEKAKAIEKAKAYEAQANEVKPKKSQTKNFREFKRRVHRKVGGALETDDAALARHSEIKKKKSFEKKVLDKARADFFEDSSLLFDEAWLIAIGEALGMEKPAQNIREIRDRINVSSMEKVKIAEQEDEIAQVETAKLTEEQITELAEVEKKDQEAIQNLASKFRETFEIAEIRRLEELKELKLMIAQEEESKVLNIEISRARAECQLMALAEFESQFVDSDDDFDIFSILKIKPKKKSFLEAFPKIERVVKKVETPKIVMGAASFEKPKKNRLCKSLKLGAAPCEKPDCNFLHFFDELKPDLCKFSRCRKVKMITRGKYVNIERGCPFTHQDETLVNFLIRDGYVEDSKFDIMENCESKCEAACESKSESVREIKPDTVHEIAIVECNAWREVNSKIYSHPTQENQPIQITKKPRVPKEDDSQNEKRTKTKLCDSLLSGNHCRHGSKCRFAHSVEELSVPNCNHGENCLFVKIENGLFYNSEGKFCKCIHPNETRANFLARNEIVTVVSPPKPECCKTKTKICISVINRTNCVHKKCKFAHDENELNIRECIFPSCKLISIDFQGRVSNIDLRNKCIFFHAGENKKSYFERMLV